MRGGGFGRGRGVVGNVKVGVSCIGEVGMWVGWGVGVGVGVSVRGVAGWDGVRVCVGEEGFSGEGNMWKVPVAGEKLRSCSLVSRCSRGGLVGVQARFCSASCAGSCEGSGDFSVTNSYSSTILAAIFPICSARVSSWTYSMPCLSATRHEQHWNWHSIFMK